MRFHDLARCISALTARALLLPLGLACACQSTTPANQDRADTTDGVPTRTWSGETPRWKERLETPYLFLDHTGDYRGLGTSIRALQGLARAGGAQPSGDLFGLFYDDPASTPIHALRSRVCLPVAPGSIAPTGLGIDVLPRKTVAYVQVSGPYDQVGRGIADLFEYLQRMGWVPAGPVREVYLVNPGAVSNPDQLITEIQLPWAVGG